MSDINPNPKAPKAASINDSLPSGNPSPKVVISGFACFALIVLVLVFHSSLGF